MAQSLGELEKDALNLSAEDRARLAVSLLLSLEEMGEDPAEVEKLWVAEAKRRAQEIDDGSSIGIPASDVLARLKSKYKEK